MSLVQARNLNKNKSRMGCFWKVQRNIFLNRHFPMTHKPKLYMKGLQPVCLRLTSVNNMIPSMVSIGNKT